MNRFVRATFVAILALGLAAPVPAPVVAAARPTVAFIVGPAGTATGSYRALAEDAARVAEAAGANVVRAYSPNATWAAVREAATGASIVVYLGHGNGWPSRYRDALYPPTQNGFGLNPVAGVDDDAHQYFGEAHVEGLRLAANAVVLLHHLCYASGNTEPGLPEGTRDQSIARVDNYAAGFIRAGARAVVAEGHLGPAFYVRELLRGRSTVEDIWARSPNRRGNTFAVASVRSPGYTARLDPNRPEGGFYRSLVSEGALRAADVRAGAAARGGTAPVGPPPEPTLANLDLAFRTPVLRERPIVGGESRLTLPLDEDALARIPEGVQVGVRWDPILAPDPPPEPEAEPPAEAAGEDAEGGQAATEAPGAASVPSPQVPSPEPATPEAGGPGGAPALEPERRDPEPDVEEPAVPQATPAPEPTPVPAPPAVSLVVPERVGSLVEIARGRFGSRGLVVDVRYPAVPGLYRLVPTLHLADGSGYDAATQALLTAVIVRVSGPVGIAWGVSTSAEVAAGADLALPVRIVNTGSAAWNLEVGGDAARRGRGPALLPARIVATWLSVTGHPVPEARGVAIGHEASAPGGQVVAILSLSAPDEPGSYLLVLDVLSPAHGPLSAAGGELAVVRVEVTGP